MVADDSPRRPGRPHRHPHLPDGTPHEPSPAGSPNRFAAAAVRLPAAVRVPITIVGVSLAVIGLTLTLLGVSVAVIRVAVPVTVIGIPLAPIGLTVRPGYADPELQAVRRPRLVVTDLDGTFLSPELTVSATNAVAAQRAADLGVPFVVATGRPVRWLGVLDGLTAAHPRVVAANGALVYDLAGREIVRDFPIDAAVADAVGRDLRRAIPGMTFGIETGTHFACEPEAPSRQSQTSGVRRGSLGELLGLEQPVLKLLAFHHDLSTDALAALARDTVGSRLTMTHASTGQPYGLLELSAPGVTKATTLALLCAELGVHPRDVAAFGDMPNDLDMLCWAGQAFVVANAHPSLIAAGFPVIGSNAEDGVGTTLLELLG